MQTLDVISVNLWQLLVSLTNLVLLFLIVKKFLYRPVKTMLQTRQSSIDGEYSAAQAAKAKAMADQTAYEAKLAGAKVEADQVIRQAVDTANRRESEILADAKAKANGIVRQAEADAALARRKAEDGIKREIVEVSSLLTEKILGREVSLDDHQKLIDAFIEGIGDEDGAGE